MAAVFIWGTTSQGQHGLQAKGPVLRAAENGVQVKPELGEQRGAAEVGTAGVGLSADSCR